MFVDNIKQGQTIRKRPILKHSILRLDDFFVWGGSMTKSAEDEYCLFFSLWHRKKGFHAWVTNSKIAYAVAASPLGPYKFRNVILPGSGGNRAWDRDVTHNPTVLREGGKYYLYYMGNRGNGNCRTHRNNQRIGVAVAESIKGPWKRFDWPLLDVSPDCWDCLMTTNPSVTKMPDGRFIMIYKGAGKKNKGPMYGPVYHGAAFSDSPLGPFVKHPEPIFTVEGAAFSAEDPFVFSYGGKLYTILKDMGTYYSPYLRSLVLFESINGTDWHLSHRPVVSTRQMEWEDGIQQVFYRLERPQLYLENGRLPVLFGAVQPDENGKESFNIHYELEFSP